MSQDLRDILKRARAGDKASEEALFEFLRVRFTYIAKRRILGEDCEDVVQSACLTVLGKYREADIEDRFEAWAYTILRNHIGTYLKRQATRRESVDKSVDVQTIEDRRLGDIEAQVRRRLLECIRKVAAFRPQYARVVNLIHQGYSTAEICDRLGITANNLYVNLNRGRAMLTRCLRGERIK